MENIELLILNSHQQVNNLILEDILTDPLPFLARVGNQKSRCKTLIVE